MKIVKEQPAFNPVTVVFETEAEIRLFVAWLGNTTIEAYKAFGCNNSVSKQYWEFPQYHAKNNVDLKTIELDKED